MGKQEYQKAIEVFHRRTLGTYTNWALGYTYGLSGDKDKAQAILQHHLQKVTTDYVPAVMISAVYMGLDDKDKALEWLEKALEEGIAPIILPEVIMGPKFKSIRQDPRYKLLLSKANMQAS